MSGCSRSRSMPSRPFSAKATFMPRVSSALAKREHVANVVVDDQHALAVEDLSRRCAAWPAACASAAAAAVSEPVQEQRGLVDQPLGATPRWPPPSARRPPPARRAPRARARRGRAGRSAARARTPSASSASRTSSGHLAPGRIDERRAVDPIGVQMLDGAVGREDHHVDVVAGAEQLQGVDVEAVALLDDRQPLDAARAEALQRVERGQRGRAAAPAPRDVGLVDVGRGAGAQRGQRARRPGRPRPPGGGASRDGT